jgi:hypothetical protein
MDRTYHTLRQYVSWEGVKNDIQQYIRKSVKCQQNSALTRTYIKWLETDFHVTSHVDLHIGPKSSYIGKIK